MNFKLISNFTPKGDQPQAIDKLIQGLNDNLAHQVLVGVTGSGKTYTMASVIANANLPTLIISPNKTLAAQLYQEFKQFFPENAVHYFVSYYDYYQPEAYIAHSNTYIEKETRINAEIDKLRHAALQSLLTRKDTLIVASVSCIYGLGDPSEYKNTRLGIKVGQKINAEDLSRHLNFLQYKKTTKEPLSGEFKMEKDKVRLAIVTGENIAVNFKKNTITAIVRQSSNVMSADIFPAKFWVTPRNRLKLALQNIKAELEQRVEELQSANRFEEAERLQRRTTFDLEMIRKIGYVNGIENYSRHLSFREAGEPPWTLLDYFPKPSLLFIDESHIAIPQLRGMYAGDRQRKEILIRHGFRLPSALDNRPLRFEEFEQKTGGAVYVSATPGQHETEKAQKEGQLVEQLIRPTGILDPEIIIRPAEDQIRDLINEIRKRAANNERTLALTLTKRQAEDLSEYLLNEGIKAHYLHSEIKTLKRPEILNDMRRGIVDVIVGINLLREGLDLPEVGLVAILDADREGFLRNHRSIMQMAGRAARALNGQVILYADEITGSIQSALKETHRRRKIQTAFNKKYGITPQTIQKPITVATILEIAGIETQN